MQGTLQTAPMKAMLPLMLLTMLAGAQILQAADPSPEIQQVLKERKSGEHDLKLDGLTGAPPTPQQLKKLEDSSSFEVYQVPYPQRAKDNFLYSIYHFKASGEVWILRSGGKTGKKMLYVVTKTN